MATLSDTALFSKKFLFFVLISLVLILTIILFIGFGKSIKNSLFPPGPAPSTIAFGKIPRIDVSEGIKANSGIQYSLDTVSGELPSLPEKLKVFENIEEEASFGALDATKLRVQGLGFNEPPQLEGGNLVTFVSKERSGLAKSLRINVSSNNFEYKVDFESDQSIISSKPPAAEKAVNLADGFFGNFNLNALEFPKDKVQTKFYRIEGINFVEVPSLSSSNIIEVVFLRADIDKIPVIFPNADKPPVKALIAENGVISAEVNKQNINFHKFSTYPLKGVRAAFDELAVGKGYFNKDIKGKVFPIREVGLAYLETKTFQKYLQPVYVFKSDFGHVAFVDAVAAYMVVD